jgi:Ca2+-binding RTX toxin-like protein
MSTPSVNSVQAVPDTLSGDYRIDDMLEGAKWGGSVGAPVSLDYSFPTATSTWDDFYGAGEPLSSPTGLNAVQQAAAVAAMANWAALANIQFNPVADTPTSVGDIRFTNTLVGAIQNSQSYAYEPANDPEAGDIWLNPNAYWDGYTSGTYGFMTFMHELGHALGLAHPFGGGLGGVVPTSEDSYSNSLMSYTALAGHPGSQGNFEPTTPMLYDIDVIQYLYGANTSYHAGDDTYNFYQGQNYFQTLWDGGGTDTIAWHASTQGATIDLRPGHWSTLGNPLIYTDNNGAFIANGANTVAIYNTVTIENASGGDANDTLTGNAVGNVLQGGAGNDTLDGEQGNDTLDGGPGLETALYNGPRQGYQVLVANGAMTVKDMAGSDGSDMLIQVERLHFSDMSVAFDLGATQAAGEAALMMGAVAGPALLNDQTVAGRVIAYFDAGNSLLQGATLLLDSGLMSALAGGSSDAALVQLLFLNIAGSLPDAATLAGVTGLLSSHALTQAQLLVVAALLDANQTHVNLVGLTASGLAYQGN